MRLAVFFGVVLAAGCGGMIADEGSEPLTATQPDAGPTAKGGADARPSDVVTPTPRPKPAPSDEPVPDPAPTTTCGNVTGVWSGSWKTTSGLSGTWENKLVEDANGGISGSSVVSGTACGTSATIVGKRSGCAIRFGFSTFGSCTVEFTGDVTDRTMSGSFHVTSGFSDQGSWSGFRTN